MPRFQDLTGQKFGRLTVVKRVEDYVSSSGRKRVQYLCKCDCGNIKTVAGERLKNRKTQSCGCFSRESSVNNALKSHGRSALIDLTGKKYNKLTVLHEVPKNGANRMWLCLCDCGKETIVRQSHIISGRIKSCGCYHNEAASVNNLQDLTNLRFGRLTVLSRDHNTKPGVTKWFCQCDCGNLVSVNAKSLKRGETKSCGCYNSEIAKKQAHDLSGTKYNMLKVIDRAPNKYDSKGQSKTFWNCLCDCGNRCVISTFYLEHGQYSCGCCKESKAEKWVEIILKRNQLKYIPQIKFKELTGLGGKPLSYDFGIYYKDKLRYLIECQGQQHYKPIDLFGGEEQFEIQQFHDELKREYAANLGIPLIEIPYTCDTEEKIKSLLQQKNIIKTNKETQ